MNRGADRGRDRVGAERAPGGRDRAGVMDWRRVAGLFLLPALILAVLVIPVPLLADRLPDPIATHWGFTGEPDGSSARTPAWLVVVVAWALAWAGLVWRSRRPGPRSGIRMPELVVALAVGGFVAGMSVVTVALNLDATSWRDAGSLPIWGVLAVLAAAFAICGAGAALESGRPAPARPDRRVGPPPTIGLAPGQRAVWLGRASSRLLIVVTLPAAAGLAAAALLVGPPEGWILLFGAAVVGVAAALTATIDVTVAPTGVRVGFGPLGLPRKVIPLERIERADAIDVDPLAWGGWGYRVPRPGTSAVVVRRGPGVLLELTGNRRFVVTVDGAPEAAGLINDLRSTWAARSRRPA
jgi:uncharacterized protein DUF1648